MNFGPCIFTTFVALALPCGCHGPRDAPEPPGGANAPSPGAVNPAHAQPAPPPRPSDPEPLAPSVQAVVHSQIQPGATHCFETGLKAAPAQAGTVVLTVNVNGAGKVSSVSAGADGALSVETVECIQWVAKRADFDAPGADDAGTAYRVLLTFP
jgi:hypothetical protein